MKNYIFLLLSIINISLAANWAVLVAGSNTFMNYRHQADICHAYQIMHENEIPDSNIIVMMYDDIAYSPENPFQGIIINKPNGSDVYQNVPKDYVGEDVNPENFLAVLRGDQQNATGRVLNTGPNDNIFVFFADHGGPGLIAFPNSYLYAHQLIETLEYMYQNDKYNYMLFYLEACESGSMFNNLLNQTMNIYATTASTPTEPSWGCFYDPNVGAFLADRYSINWMLNSDSFENDWMETLSQQYFIVQNETTSSTVCQYGDSNMSSLPLKDFMIFQNISRHVYKNNFEEEDHKNMEFVDSRDVKVETLMRNYMAASGDEKKSLFDQLQQEFFSRQLYDYGFKKMYNAMQNNDNGCYPNYKLDTHCLEKLVENYEFVFGRFTDYGMKYIRVLAENCKVRVN